MHNSGQEHLGNFHHQQPTDLPQFEFQTNIPKYLIKMKYNHVHIYITVPKKTLFGTSQEEVSDSEIPATTFTS